MLCSMCNQKEAILDREVDLGYGKVHVFLCESCANKVRENQPEPTVEVLDFWTQNEKTLVCPKCQATANDIEKTNYVGCEECYRMFEPEIERIVTILHGRASNVGRCPNGEPSKSESKMHLSKNEDERNLKKHKDFDPNAFNKKFFGGGK